MLGVFAGDDLPDARAAVEADVGADEEHGVVPEGEAGVARHVDGGFGGDAVRRPERFPGRLFLAEIGKPLVGRVFRSERADEDRSVAVVGEGGAVGREARVFARREAPGEAGADVEDPHAPAGIARAEAGEADCAPVRMPARGKRGERRGGDGADAGEVEPARARAANAPALEAAPHLAPDDERAVGRDGGLDVAGIVAVRGVEQDLDVAGTARNARRGVRRPQIEARQARGGGVVVGGARRRHAARRDEIDAPAVGRDARRVVAAAAAREVALRPVRFADAQPVAVRGSGLPGLVRGFGIVPEGVDERAVRRPCGVGRVAGALLDPFRFAGGDVEDPELERAALEPPEGDARTVRGIDGFRAAHERRVLRESGGRGGEEGDDGEAHRGLPGFQAPRPLGFHPHAIGRSARTAPADPSSPRRPPDPSG